MSWDREVSTRMAVIMVLDPTTVNHYYDVGVCYSSKNYYATITISQQSLFEPEVICSQV